MIKQVNVAVGVVEKEGMIFVCKRAADAHQGGLWEFPGGKIESDETVQQALSRELYEEIDIQVTSSAHLLDIHHDYGDKKVSLYVYKVTEFLGEAVGKEGQPFEWRAIADLHYQDFPAANKVIIDALKAQ